MQQSTQAALRAMSVNDILVQQLEKLQNRQITEQEIVQQLLPFDQNELQNALNRVMVRNQSQERHILIQILRQKNLLTQQMANFYQTFMEESQPIKVTLDEYLRGKNANNYVTHAKLIKGAQKENNFYLTFKDDTAQAQCLFMLPLIQDKDVYDRYRKLKAQKICEIRNAIIYGEPPKLKISKKSSITVIDEPPLDQVFELITKNQIKQEEELDLVAIVKEVRPSGSHFKTVIFLTGTESGQLKQGQLNLWNQFKELELPVNSVFLVETVLIKSYNNTYELNTTKTQTKFHTTRDTVPQELLQYWDSMSNMRDMGLPKSPIHRRQPVQIQLQNSGQKQIVQTPPQISLEDIFQSTDDKIFDVIAYVRYVGEPQIVKGANFETRKVSLSIEDNSRKANLFLWDAFSNMEFQISKIYFFQGVQYKARYQELKTIRGTQILVEDKVTNQEQLQRIAIFKQNYQKSLSTIKKIVNSKKKLIEGQKVLTLVEGLGMIQGEQNNKSHTFVTKAQVIDFQIYDLKHICQICSDLQLPNFFRQKSKCPKCEKEDFIEFNIGCTIADHTTHIQITLQDSCLSIIPYNPDLSQIKHYEMYFKEFLMFKSFWMKCRYNPNKQPSFRLAVSDLEEVNELDLIALLLI